MHAFVGADQHRMIDAGEDIILAGRQRLLDQRYLQFCCKPQIIFNILVIPTFIGVYDDARFGCGRAHGPQAGFVVSGAGLDLQQRTACIFRGLRGHCFRVGKRNRIGGDERLCRLSESLFGGALAADLRLKVPERAIDRIARRTRFHRLLQFLPCQAGGDPLCHRLDIGKDTLDAFAITRIGHAFTFADEGTFTDGARYDIRMRAGAA